MTLRRPTPLVLFALALSAAPAAAQNRVQTANFVVEAANRELAEQFARAAERYRKEKAVEWLGYEMPAWPQKCPLKVKVTMGQTGGATTFTFGSDGRKPAVLSQEMQIFGTHEQLMFSVLPHEVTHTVLAHHFGQPVPRWADEGGSVLSENDDERFNHDVRCREILNQGRGIALRHLFPMKEYPKDMIVLYAQGYSVTAYLVDLGGGGQAGRAKLLQFLRTGMQNNGTNWDAACQMYNFGGVDELQETWIQALRTPPTRVAARGGNRARPAAMTAGVSDLPTPPGQTEAVGTLAVRGPETRSSAITALPRLEDPVVARGVAPAGGSDRTFGGSPVTAPAPAAKLPPALGLLPPEPAGRR